MRPRSGQSYRKKIIGVSFRDINVNIIRRLSPRNILNEIFFCHKLKRNVINQADFEEFTTENKYEFRTLTSIVKGMYNIMNQVQDALNS